MKICMKCKEIMITTSNLKAIYFIVTLTLISVLNIQAQENPWAYNGQWYVSPTGSDNNSGVDSVHAFSSIQHAIDVSTVNDTIIILAGTYYPADYSTAAIKVNNKSYLTFIGRGQGKTIIDGSTSSNSKLWQVGAYPNYSNNITIKHLTVTGKAQWGILIQGHHNTVKYVTTHSTRGYGNGIDIWGGSYNYIGYCTFTTAGVNMRNGIHMESRVQYGYSDNTRLNSCIVEHNTITSAGHVGINIFPESSSAGVQDSLVGNVIRYNVMKHCKVGMYLRRGLNTEIYGNAVIGTEVVDPADNLYCFGIFLAQAFNSQDPTTWHSYTKIYNNTVLDTKGDAFYNERWGDMDIRNNIFSMTDNCNTTTPIVPMHQRDFTNMTMDYNVYNSNLASPTPIRWNWSLSTIANMCNAFSKECNSVYGDPLFTDKANDDVTLNTGSPAIDAGVNLGTFYQYDINGNIRGADGTWDIGAFEYSSNGIGDITPPDLQGAVLNNSTSLKLSFSEQVNTSTAQNINNYSINNGITVTAASVSGSQVTLTTSAHSFGNYVVTVNNVTDLSGNVINPNQNTAAYNYTTGDVTPPNLLSATVINPTTIELGFSESLESSSALNKLNYTINNGIVVNSVSLSTDLKKITLSTTQNAANRIYTVVVSNVKDLTGNIISSSNTATYQFVSTENLTLLSVNNVIASVVPEALHTPAKTMDGKGVNDGDPDSRWAGDTMPEWLLYDFGSSPTINLVRLSFYDWNSGRIYNYSLQTSNDLVSWSNVITNAQSAGEEWTAQIIGSVNARYLKVIFNSNNQNDWAGLWEAQFWGSPANNIDVTPPDLKSAAVLNSTAIALLFSEPLETTSAQTKTNYSINNGIVVNSAVLSVDKKSVTLNTTQHTANQTYTVTVSNVKDLAGNIISANNSAQYSFVDNTVGDLKANVKIYLQGPFLSSNMMTELSGNEFLPASQPYNVSPWFYNGTEVLGSGASTSTDWVLVELRSAQNPAQVISRRACLLRNDGRIIETNGTLGVTFKNLIYGSYYIAVFHRNHLAVMTSVPVSFSPDNSLYDFTNALTKAYGQSAMAEITTGVFGMYAGDGDGNGTINEIDRSEIWSNQNGTMGYLNGDFNLDSGVTVKDINDYWNFNEAKFTQVP